TSSDRGPVAAVDHPAPPHIGQQRKFVVAGAADHNVVHTRNSPARGRRWEAIAWRERHGDLLGRKEPDVGFRVAVARGCRTGAPARRPREVLTRAPGSATRVPGSATRAPEGATRGPGSATRAPEDATRAPGGATRATRAYHTRLTVVGSVSP